MFAALIKGRPHMPNPKQVSKAASILGRIGAHSSWANTKDRTSRTAPARAALEQKFLDQADGDPVRAAHLRQVYYQRLALKSVEARRKRGGGQVA